MSWNPIDWLSHTTNSRQARRRTAQQVTTAAAESLEKRELLSATTRAIIDFDGAVVSAQNMTEGGWTNEGLKNAGGFYELFTNANPALDVNGDGGVNINDYYEAKAEILRIVQQDYAPYNLYVTEGQQHEYQFLMSSDSASDVIVIVTGTDNQELGFGDFAGITPIVDLGNQHDDLGFVFAKGYTHSYNNADQYINAIARTISHEMGHAFGLGHVRTPAAGYDADALSHHLMSARTLAGTETRDFGHEFGFQDIAYESDALEYQLSLDGLDAVLADSVQNAHQILSRPDVLGPARGAWAAVLKPGELTVSGSSQPGNMVNTIWIDELDAETWKINSLSWLSTPEGYLPVNNSWTTDTINPDIHSLNPFDAPLDQITIYGTDYADTITVDADIEVDAVIFGFGENDILIGGSGNDMLYGGSGMDQLMGRIGADFLDGGDDRIRDILDGGNDQHRDIFANPYQVRYDSRLRRNVTTYEEQLVNRDTRDADSILSRRSMTNTLTAMFRGEVEKHWNVSLWADINGLRRA